ncbi:MAG: hypothetical protein A2173_11565 [Planctomycetes bacterium RBG_13_44_8b]|nr:MAG: hypothetical protein A2173_11565 [Planctomycetes bacterium RBG_13_44_8b]
MAGQAKTRNFFIADYTDYAVILKTKMFFKRTGDSIYYYLFTMLVCSILHTSIVHMDIETEEI